MRTIKFRAWNKSSEKWVDLDAHFSFDTDGELYQTDFKQIELMQFTGLLDKNGKEIYEGDILSNDEVEGEVYYSNRGTWDCESFILGGINEKSEVIGNIYENKDLLT